MALKFSILGGAGEIGMNSYVYETDSSAIIIDCGVMFADLQHPGVDFIVPDFTYLNEIKEKLKAIILTHGHEDHIGGVPYLLKYFNLDIYAGKLTAKLLEVKLKDNKISKNVNIFSDNDEICIDDFKIFTLPINHSISDTYAIHILHQDCNFLHMSDFKIDNSPVNGNAFSPKIFLEAQLKGIDCLVSDSTNVNHTEATLSESSVKADLKEIISEHKGRIFFTTFASNVDRISQVIEICKEIGRKVIFDGKAIIKNINIATELGYISIDSDLTIGISDAKNYLDNQLCYIISGCQGERQSTLFKVVSQERKNLKIKKGDLFIISARVIPGNEKNLNETINNIYVNGGEVIDIQKKNIHVSGHASAEELKIIYKLTKPKYLIPIHGEYFHLKKQISLGISSKFFKEENAIFAVTGNQLIFENHSLIDKKEIPFGRTYIDRRGDFCFNEEILKIRKHLSRDGIAIIKVFIDVLDTIVAPVELITKGFSLNQTQDFLLRKFIMENLRLLNDKSKNDIEHLVEKLAKQFFRKKLDRRPIISVIIIQR